MATLKKNGAGEYYTTYNAYGSMKTIHFTGEIRNWMRENCVELGDDLPDGWHKETQQYHYTHGIPSSNQQGEHTAQCRCPKCGNAVFYYQNEQGSKVYFDELGWPWPKHPCFAKKCVENKVDLKQFVSARRDEATSSRCEILDHKQFNGKNIFYLRGKKEKYCISVDPLDRDDFIKSDVYIRLQDASIMFVKTEIIIRKFQYFERKEFSKLEKLKRVAGQRAIATLQTNGDATKKTISIKPGMKKCKVISAFWGFTNCLLHLKGSRAHSYYIRIILEKQFFSYGSVLKKSSVYLDINNKRFLVKTQELKSYSFQELSREKFFCIRKIAFGRANNNVNVTMRSKGTQIDHAIEVLCGPLSQPTR